MLFRVYWSNRLSLDESLIIAYKSILDELVLDNGSISLGQDRFSIQKALLVDKGLDISIAEVFGG